MESPEGDARVRRVEPDGTIGTVVGGGTCGEEDESEPLSLCGGASDIAVDAESALYVHDRASDAVWRVTSNGERTRLPIYLSGLTSLTFDLVALGETGDLYVGRLLDREQRYLVQRVSLSVSVPPADTTGGGTAWEDRAAGTMAPVAGTGDGGFFGDGGRAVDAQLAEPGRLAVGPDGTVYVIDRGNGRVRSIGADGAIETVAGNGEQSPPPKEVAGPAPGDGQLATEVPLPAPATAGSDVVAAGPDGSVYLGGGASHRVFRVSPLGVITTFAGTGEQAYAGDGGLAVDAALAEPADVAVGLDGSVYIADSGNSRVREIRPDGTIITVAELDRPVAVDVAQDGTMYAVAGGRIWRVDTSGTIPHVTPYADDVTNPDDIAVGPDGLLYVSSGSQVFVIRDDGTTRLVAGTGTREARSTASHSTRLATCTCPTPPPTRSRWWCEPPRTEATSRGIG